MKLLKSPTFQGADIFKYPIDIEVQYANQSAIAAIEQVGGRIRCAYYDQRSVEVGFLEKYFSTSSYKKTC